MSANGRELGTGAGDRWAGTVSVGYRNIRPALSVLPVESRAECIQLSSGRQENEPTARLIPHRSDEARPKCCKTGHERQRKQ